MKIGETYWRTSPKGDKGMISIENQKEKEYHESLEKEGFKYLLQPVVTASVCTSCEA